MMRIAGTKPVPLLSGSHEMVSNDVQDELAEGFTPTPLPPVAPDGGLELPKMREAPRHPPRLCEQGPCRHYHTFKIQLDAQKPMAVRKDDGTVEQPEAPDHEETHHYCYPDVGIESKLGGLPVIQCNRWSPIPLEQRKIDELRVEAWLATDEGKQYIAELDAYGAERERIARELADASEAAAEDLAAMPVGTCELVLEIDRGGAVGPTLMPSAFTWDATLQDVRDRFFSSEFVKMPTDEYGAYRIICVHASGHAVLIRPAPDHHPPGSVDLTTTISQAGLSSGDRLLFTRDTNVPPNKEHP